MTLVITDMNLILNWKKDNKTYKIVKDLQIDLPDEAISYLKKVYPKNNIVNILDRPKKDLPPIAKEPIEIKTTPDEVTNLEDLVEDKKEEIDIKSIIEDAIKKKIIIQNGMWYQYNGNNICRGINKLKNALKQDSILLNEIRGKL